MVIPIPFLCWRWGLEGRYLTAEKAVFWDGKSETGESVSSGTSFYQIQAEYYTETRKMVILKQLTKRLLKPAQKITRVRGITESDTKVNLDPSSFF